DPRVQDRVEPHVRVGVVQRQPGEHVDSCAVRLARRRADRRLEPVAEVEDNVRVDDPADRPGRELEVVRFDALWGEVHDVVCGAADSLGRERDRIEGGHHRLAAVRRGRRAATGEEREAEDNENNSRNHLREDTLPEMSWTNETLVSLEAAGYR